MQLSFHASSEHSPSVSQCVLVADYKKGSENVHVYQHCELCFQSSEQLSYRGAFDIRMTPQVHQLQDCNYQKTNFPLKMKMEVS